MNRRNLAAVATLCLTLALGSHLSGSEGNAAALAQSSGAWMLERSSISLLTPGAEITQILPGDTLATREDGIRLHTKSGDSVLLGDAAKATMNSSSSVSLEQGRMAVSFKRGSELRPEVKGLQIAPLGGTASDTGEPLLLAAVLDDGNVLMRSISHSFAVRQAGSTTPLATLSTGDALLFRNTTSGWGIAAASGTMPFYGDDVMRTGALTESKEKTIIPWWWFESDVVKVGAGLALIGGGIALWDEGTDDDGSGGGSGDGDSTFFPGPSSPVSSNSSGNQGSN